MAKSSYGILAMQVKLTTKTCPEEKIASYQLKRAVSMHYIIFLIPGSYMR